jgi:hypothetical protein
MATSAKPASRFSTLKVFKFSAAKQGQPTIQQDLSRTSSDDSPPPPPPKDSYYLFNRSLSSLSPDPSLPPTPYSPQTQFAQRPSPGPSRSTMSLVSSTASVSPPPGEPSSGRRKEKETLGRSFFKFKRNPKSPSPKGSPNVRLQAGGDENISLPWNFQVRPYV